MVTKLLPHKFISEFDFRPRKFRELPLATDIRDKVRPRSTFGSGKMPTFREGMVFDNSYSLLN